MADIAFLEAIHQQIPFDVNYVRFLNGRPSSGQEELNALVIGEWPKTAHIDLWLKEIAPSDSLRRWFNHETQKWPEFQKRYAKELEAKEEMIDSFHQEAKKLNTIMRLY